MLKTASLVITLILNCSLVRGGLSGTQLAYRAGFLPSTLAFGGAQHYRKLFGSTTYGTPYTVPLPVAPTSARGHHLYAAVGYSIPPIVKFHSSGANVGCDPYTAYDSVRSHNMFAFPAPVPSIYNAPAPVSVSGFEVPNTIVKFGPPITTTTTTYSTSTGAVAVPLGNHLNPVAGW